MGRFYRFAEKAIETAGEAGERKREHAIRLATMGEKSRMAELERTQLGETRRAGLAEAGRMAGEAGLEKRHLREFGPESYKAQESTLRFAPGGLEERQSRLTAGSAAERLGDVMKERERKEGLERYGWGAEESLLSYTTTDEEGKTVMEPWAQKLYFGGKRIAETDPEGGVAYIREGIAEHDRIKTIQDKIATMTPKQKTDRLAELTGGTRKPEEERLPDISPVAIPPKVATRPTAPPPPKKRLTRLEEWQIPPEKGLEELGSTLRAGGRLIKTPAEYYWKRLGDADKYLLESQKRSREQLPAYGR